MDFIFLFANKGQDQENREFCGGGAVEASPSFHLGIYIVTANSVVNPVQ